MAESADERHARWAQIHTTATMQGWDFSPLSGRLTADDPPWDFDASCLEAMAAATECLDMGTGGGERLGVLVSQLDSDPNRRRIHASEGWEPNLPLAASVLAGFGVDVREYDSESGEPMPWSDGFFDLVMNRHESHDPTELARVISPGGLFLTQQVDGTEAHEFREWFGGAPEAPDNRLEPCVEALEAQGLRITDADEWTGTMCFADVEAVIEYLAYIPWDVPGFTVADNLGALDRLAARSAPIEVTQKRFRVSAQR